MGVTATSFQREAGPILKDAGYRYMNHNSSAHAIWRHPDGRPDIHVPGTPSGGRDSMLGRIRRAVRKGTPLTPPAGVERDMVKAKTEKPMSEKLLEVASPYMLKRAEERRRRLTAGDKTPMQADKRYPKELAEWMRQCILTYGRVLGSDIKLAAAELMLDASQVSDARKQAGCVTYRVKGMDKGATWTDFVSKLPADAMVFGGRGSTVKAPWRAPKSKIVEKKASEKALPKDPDEAGGRRLDQGGLTEAQRLEAERMMRESTERADREIAERQAIGRDMPAVVVGETENGNGAMSRVPAGMLAAVELLLQQAMDETHALTPEDLVYLRGWQDTCRRQADDLMSMASGIGKMLERVQTKTAVAA